MLTQIDIVKLRSYFSASTSTLYENMGNIRLDYNLHFVHLTFLPYKPYMSTQISRKSENLKYFIYKHLKYLSNVKPKRVYKD